MGTLEPSKLANTLVVDGKPDQNISDTRKISVLMKEGSIIDRDKLKLNPATDPDYRPIGSNASS